MDEDPRKGNGCLFIGSGCACFIMAGVVILLGLIPFIMPSSSHFTSRWEWLFGGLGLNLSLAAILVAVGIRVIFPRR